MARQTAPVEVNSFIRGLITEASPLTFPENASLDEDNFELLRDGSRRRRLGMDFEEGHQFISTGINTSPAEEVAINTFQWENAGGTPDKTVLVVQIGSSIRFFDLDISPISSGEIHFVEVEDADPSLPFSFTSVDGRLVCATGRAEVTEFIYEDGEVSERDLRLKVRDLWGVSAFFQGNSLREGNNISRRINAIGNAHTYNLRNQSWGTPRTIGDGGSDSSSTDLEDPISAFFQESGLYPSNADTVTQVLYADPADSNNRTGDQFFPKDLRDNPIGNMPAARGHFIIDALDRGSSRLQSVQDNQSRYPQLSFPVGNLPVDRTPGGARCVSEYAGRVWYGGFSGEVIGGDDHSPRMSSYVLYSKLVQDSEDIATCYQEGDPTSKDAPDLLDTDGGYIRIDGAYRIFQMVNVGSGLLVLAQNGVWMISGGSDYGFTANNNKVTKISERGVDSPGSVVVVDNTVIFWADDAIYHIHTNEFGDWVSSNLSQTTIQRFYEEIRPIDKFYCQGQYDSYEGKVRWVYQNRLYQSSETRELVFDVNLGSFYTSTIKVDQPFPKVVSPLLVPPFRLIESYSQVVVNGEPVVVNGLPVEVEERRRGEGSREVAYLIVTSLSPLEFTFGYYRDVGFRDFRSLDGVGVDAEAFLITGWLSGGDFQRYKQVPYIQFYFNRTEDGFEEDETGNWYPTSQSSCLVQAQWNWTNSRNSNMWGRQFEAYRYRRQYLPDGLQDPFDTGDRVIQSKNKLRGKGKVLSLYIKTSPDKDCQLLGWSMLVGVTGNV